MINYIDLWFPRNIVPGNRNVRKAAVHMRVFRGFCRIISMQLILHNNHNNQEFNNRYNQEGPK